MPDWRTSTRPRGCPRVPRALRIAGGQVGRDPTSCCDEPSLSLQRIRGAEAICVPPTYWRRPNAQVVPSRFSPLFPHRKQKRHPKVPLCL